MTRNQSSFITLISLAFLTAGAPSSTPRTPLAAEARALIGKARPERIALATTRDSLIRSMSLLQTFLARSGPERLAGWKRYLRWTELERELSKTPLTSADPHLLREIQTRYRANYQGLELRPFLRVRASLASHTQRLNVAKTTNFARLFDLNLERLAQNLEAWEAHGDPALIREAGPLIGWFAASSQAPLLVKHVRSALSRPNLKITVDAGYLPLASFVKDVDQSEVMSDVFQGIALTANARTRGRLTVGALPSRNHAAIELHLKATTHAESIGKRPPVTMRGSSVTQSDVRKTVFLDAHGIQVTPSVAFSTTSSVVKSISVLRKLGWRIIQRIAWRKALEAQPAANAAMSRKAEARLVQQMDKEFLKLAELPIEYANSFYREILLHPMLRTGTFPELFELSGTSNTFELLARKAETFQLGAPTPAPAPPDAPKGIAFQIHASFPENFAERWLGGTTVTDETVETLVRILASEIPEALWVEPEGKRWSVSFPPRGALKARFAEDKTELLLLIDGSSVDGEVSHRPVEILAQYGFDRHPTEIKIIRMGKVIVRYASETPASASPEKTDRIDFLSAKFNAFFPQHIKLDINALSSGRLPEKIFSHLKLRQIGVENGWISAGLR